MDSGIFGKTKIIAVCGKGGAGKTTVSAIIVKILCADTDKKILAIDADPAVGAVHECLDNIFGQGCN